MHSLYKVWILSLDTFIETFESILNTCFCFLLGDSEEQETSVDGLDLFRVGSCAWSFSFWTQGCNTCVTLEVFFTLFSSSKQEDTFDFLEDSTGSFSFPTQKVTFDIFKGGMLASLSFLILDCTRTWPLTALSRLLNNGVFLDLPGTLCSLMTGWLKGEL